VVEKKRFIHSAVRDAGALSQIKARLDSERRPQKTGQRAVQSHNDVVRIARHLGPFTSTSTSLDEANRMRHPSSKGVAGCVQGTAALRRVMPHLCFCALFHSGSEQERWHASGKG
jgi:hypothetical protein